MTSSKHCCNWHNKSFFNFCNKAGASWAPFCFWTGQQASGVEADAWIRVSCAPKLDVRLRNMTNACVGGKTLVSTSSNSSPVYGHLQIQASRTRRWGCLKMKAETLRPCHGYGCCCHDSSLARLFSTDLKLSRCKQTLLDVTLQLYAPPRFCSWRFLTNYKCNGEGSCEIRLNLMNGGGGFIWFFLLSWFNFKQQRSRAEICGECQLSPVSLAGGRACLSRDYLLWADSQTDTNQIGQSRRDGSAHEIVQI